MSLPQHYDLILRRHEEITARLGAGVNGAEYSALSRELAELGPVAEAIRNWRAKDEERRDLAALLAEPGVDAQIAAMARAELAQAEADVATLAYSLRLALLPKDAADDGNVILEVRAGTGGDEAALFASDLFQMYAKYAALQKWETEVLSSSEGAAGGYKEIIAEIRGRGPCVSVAVLPEAQEIDYEIKESDLKIDTMRSSGAGGQHVNKTESAIRITHLPTGVVVAMQEERSQHRNRAKAMAVLRSRIMAAKNQAADDERAKDRREQVGSGDRSQRIRTYNFPQSRLTDHRIGLTLYSLEKLIQGEGLDEVIAALTADRQARLLAAQASG